MLSIDKLTVSDETTALSRTADGDGYDRFSPSY